MILSCILHSKECWPTSTKTGLLNIKAGKQSIIKTGEEMLIPVGFSMSIPKGYALKVLRSAFIIREEYVFNGEKLGVTIINNGDKLINLKKGDPIGALMLVPYEELTLSVEGI